jgi:SAM-dependent methyltransferase
MDLTEQKALECYSDYLEFIKKEQLPPARILDIGCGTGWSAWVLANAGYSVVGADLNPEAFEVAPMPNMKLQKANIMSLPFQSESFDIVACYQLLEHIPKPEQALREMLRMVRPNGMIVVVGPNLLGLLGHLRMLFVHVWRNRPMRTILVRSAEMPQHPFGNTFPEIVASMAMASYHLLQKSLCPIPKFVMRVPDSTPPFHGDNDSCYMCNPIDLVKFFRFNNCRILRNGKHGRPPLTWPFVTGTYVAVQKK